MRAFFILWFGGVLVACSEREHIVSSPPVDLFDKFTTRIVVPSALLPALPTNIKFFPDTREFLVLGKRGEIRHLVLEDTTARLLGAFIVPEVAPGPEEIGLTGIAFDPQFASNQFFYVCFVTGDNKWCRILRYRWSGNYAEIVRSYVTVLNIDRFFPDEPQHGLYSLCFGPDGNLYVPVGDALQPEYAQDPQSLLGKLLRIRPRHGPDGSYDIPADNPFRDEEKVLPEIAAFGLRTPFRSLCWKDKIYIANVGRNRYEEIEMYTIGGKANFGWPLCEGYCETGGYNRPVITVSHADPFYQTQDPQQSRSNRLSIGVGLVYEQIGDDPYHDLLDGRLLFFDVFQGYVRAAKLRDDGYVEDEQHIFHTEYIMGMDFGQNGYIYVTTMVPPQILRIELK
ncbi:MAG: PQQ-dependent sugar dehydrogenase [candidate division KSB1 bacterium]